MRTTGILIASLFVAGSVMAAPKTKLFLPPHINEVRDIAVQLVRKAQNLDWQTVQKAHVKLAGYTPQKTAIYMVKIPGQKAAFVKTWQKWNAEWKYNENKGKLLSASDMKRLGVITPEQAMATALDSKGKFGKVTGKVSFDGASRKGFSYAITVTPEKPVMVKEGTWGYTEVTQLKRLVNGFGKGETAYPSVSRYIRNQPLQTRTRPAIGQ